ncbi:MAG: transposase family protein, partial [Planctomycetaceae bacterium]|nr:transposase family protein [Planctomycetaceae bacterium]
RPSSDLPTGESAKSLNQVVTDALEHLHPVQKQYFTNYGHELHLLNDVLIRRKTDGPSVLMVPALYRYEIMMSAHDLIGAHRGIDTTYKRLQEKFDWPGMLTHIRDYVKTCDACQRFRAPNPKRRLELRPIVSEYFNHIVQIDFEQLSRTPSGYQFMLVIVDHFTKWADAYPMKDLSAKAVAKIIFERWICVHGPMRILQSDQGPQFEARLFQKFAKRMGIVKIRSTAYHPQTNGLVERQNRTLIAMLRVYLSRHQDNWPEKLPTVLFAYRTSVHQTTKQTPYKTVYGIEAPTSLEWYFPDFKMDYDQDPELALAAALERDLQASNEVVRHNHDTSQRRQKIQFDKRIHGHADHQVNDLVLIFMPALRTGVKQVRKLRPRWVGPFRVIEVIGDRNYRLDVPNFPDGKVVNWENTIKYETRMGHIFVTDVGDIDFDWDTRIIWGFEETTPFNEEERGQIACEEEQAGIEPDAPKRHNLRDRAKLRPPTQEDYIFADFEEETDEEQVPPDEEKDQVESSDNQSSSDEQKDQPLPIDSSSSESDNIREWPHNVGPLAAKPGFMSPTGQRVGHAWAPVKDTVHPVECTT